MDEMEFAAAESVMTDLVDHYEMYENAVVRSEDEE
jgi:hypothetical protein